MKALLVLGYLSMSLLTAGALLADLQGEIRDDFDFRFAQENYRSQLGTAVLIALIPVTWVISPLMTGFYEHGWRLSRPKRPLTASNSKVPK